MGVARHNLRAIASHPLTASEPWALGALVTSKGTLDLGLDMTECGMPFAATYIPCGPNRLMVSAMLPGGTAGVQVTVHPTTAPHKIAAMLSEQVQHYRPTLEAEHQRRVAWQQTQPPLMESGDHQSPGSSGRRPAQTFVPSRALWAISVP